MARLKTDLTTARTFAAALESSVKDGFKLHNPVVATWLDEEAIKEADQRTEKARNYINHLHRVLWRVDEQHHVPEDAPEDVCRCGVAADECPTFRALDQVREKLYKWEREELERLKKGWQHNLPKEHPEVPKYDHSDWRRPA
ncbi:hypothetical protein VV02_13270 [Luteipulveratus mongoliensis]|uniref:Uncharacterized protein n=1 Tax=Luteipulveratus mongoliensis TaxID=571913 RepID=A0A0K1JIS7_9MICO|nr:hypothetical protein VV02_13270 [Luteipulveratus mongoliensis]